jgi:2-polyprenyl-3-methyl-5-hydroxy-6-metoxy-1,4-benzoquinol methylase
VGHTDGLERLIDPVAGKTLLDVGMGDGELASEMVQYGAIVTGLDKDPVMIAAAQRRIKLTPTPMQLIELQVENPAVCFRSLF